jgi:hypothetical protein
MGVNASGGHCVVLFRDLGIGCNVFVKLINVFFLFSFFFFFIFKKNKTDDEVTTRHLVLVVGTLKKF